MKRNYKTLGDYFKKASRSSGSGDATNNNAPESSASFTFHCDPQPQQSPESKSTKNDTKKKEGIPVKSFTFPKTQCLNQSRACQHQYFEMFSWLRYDYDSDSVKCFNCMSAEEKKLFKAGRKLNQAFLNDGFNSWKKCPKAMEDHEASDQHQEATEKIKAMQIMKNDVMGMISDQYCKDQGQHQTALIAIVQSAIYLLTQGLPFQGRDDDSGNFIQLLHLRSNDIPALKAWLTRRDKWCSHDIQNEIVTLIANAVREEIKAEVTIAEQFSIIADGTQDITGQEQLAIVYRYVITETMEVVENFVGFYHLPDSSGITTAKAIEDTAVRMQLDMHSNRGLGFDGASCMSGRFKGARSILNDKYPLSLYFHCSNHALDLCLQEISSEEDIIFSSLEFVRNCATFVRGSGKRRAQFQEICSQLENGVDGGDERYTTVQALCPTRWVVRVRALKSIEQNWKPLQSLFSIIASDSCTTADIRAKASGLLKQLHSFKRLIGIKLGIVIFSPCENLSRQLQNQSTTATSALSGSQFLAECILGMRCDDAFNSFYEETLKRSAELEIEEPPPPKQKKVPKRFEYSSAPTELMFFSSFQHSMRQQYFSVLDRLLTEIRYRFDQPGLKFAYSVEQSLIAAANATINSQEMEKLAYPEISTDDLKRELYLLNAVIKQGLKESFAVKSLHDILTAFRNVPPTTRQLVPHTTKLLQLLMTFPATAASAERSFSCLRRLKTYLRSTMSQERLSDIAVCAVHKQRAQRVNVVSICKTFVENSYGNERRFVFGKF